MTTKAEWLVAYDIASPKRLGRVHRLLSRSGLSVQYSLFLVRATAQDLGSTLAELARRIDAREDDVRAYQLRRNHRPIVVGAGCPGILTGGILPTRAGRRPEGSAKIVAITDGDGDDTP